MKKENKREFWIAMILLAAFVLWTVLVRALDVQAIGPNGSFVGFATLNGFVHALTGTNLALYVITDWLGFIPFFVALGFAVLGLCQWIKRKRLTLVDRNILALGVFYVIVMAVYVLFEFVVINYRPILIDGRAEASYPSSTTMLVTCVMPTAIMQCRARIKNKALQNAVTLTIAIFVVFMVIERLLSGVHWISDIIGGLLFSAGLVALYASVAYEQKSPFH